MTSRDVSNYRPNLLTAIDVQAVLGHFCMEDYTQCLTNIKQKIRRASEKTYQTTDHLATYKNVGTKMPGVGNQNVDSDGGLHEGVLTPSPTTQFGRHSYIAMSIMDTSAS